jgi:hypothetical protein
MLGKRAATFFYA